MVDEQYQGCLSPSGQMRWRADTATEVVAGGKGEFEPQPSASLAHSHQHPSKIIRATGFL